jgi:hypothetical protein
VVYQQPGDRAEMVAVAKENLTLLPRVPTCHVRERQ